MLRWIRALVPVVAVLGFLMTGACGSNDPFPSNEPESSEIAGLDNTRPPVRLMTPTSFYRLDLSLTAEGIVTATSVTRVLANLRPVPSPEAEYLAVAYAGDQIESAVPVSFPRTALSTERDPSGGWIHTELALTSSAESVFLEADPAVDRLVIFARDGTMVLDLTGQQLPMPPIPSAPDSNRRPMNDPIGLTRQRLTVEQLALRYPQIEFLEPGPATAMLLPPNLVDGATIVTPSEELNDILVEVLDRLSPMLVVSLRTVAWAKYPPGHRLETAFGSVAGSTLVVNAGKTTTVSEATVGLAHEVAHAFGFLSQALGLGRPTAKWPEAAQAAAAEMIRRFRLTGGFEQVWFQLQATGVKAGHARAYTGASETAWKKLSQEEAMKGGFASPYGSFDEHEDTAEYIGYLLFPTPKSTGICPVFDGKSTVDLDIAIPYAKLLLLLATDLISKIDFNRCVHSAKLEMKAGIDFAGAVTFTQNLKAGWSVDQGIPYFDVLGDGSNTYRFLVQMRLDAKNASPLGLHRLDSIWVGNVGASGSSGAFLANDNFLLARASAEGMVLVTKVGDEGTEGAIFGLVLQNALGLDTDHFPLGTFRIP